MLKSCWDCILGYSREQADNEVVYGTRLNGNSVRAPPWPRPREDKETMFILPRGLSRNDQITVEGTLSPDREFVFNLITGNSSPDFTNIAFQIKAVFPHEGSSYENKISIKMIQHGTEVFSEDHENYTATDLFAGGNFTISIKILEDNVADTNVNNAPFMMCKMEHDLSDIRFLSVNGDDIKVNRLEFNFANY